MGSSLSALTSLAGVPASSDVESPKPSKRIEDAAKQFEALMISQMMKSARESSGGGWLSDGDQTGEDSSMGMAETQFAQTMANNGGLGLAKMVVKTMMRVQAADPASAQSGASSSATGMASQAKP